MMTDDTGEAAKNIYTISPVIGIFM